MTVDCDFPGGNILVDSIDGDTIAVHEDLRDTLGNWFYWYFRVRGAAGRSLSVRFTGRNVIGVRGPAVSLDAGRSWRWLGQESVEGQTFTFRMPPNCDEVRFSMGMPYLEADLQAFLTRHRDSPFLEIGQLCKTEKGRFAERLRLGRLDGGATHRILLTCRHHCCEMMASYVLEGLMETVLTDPDSGAWLRDQAEFLVVPFVDKDGVEQGDQGKNRAPHDHNRDYSGRGRYATVRAIRRQVPRWGGDRLRMVLDLHCPYIRGGHDQPGHNESIFFPGCADPEIWARTLRFSEQLARRTAAGPLPHDPADNLPFGEGWNKRDPNAKGRGCKAWASTLPGLQIAATLEVAYADARGREVNAETARAFGKDLAGTIRDWLAGC